MSASERLRALDGAIKDPQFPFTQDGYLWSLGDALPLIADVVEAAENEVPLLRGRVLERAMEQRERDGLGFALDESPTLAALTALREHLEGGDESQQVRHAREPWTEAQLDSVRRLRYDKGGE